jgi:hypothetical protein
MQIDLELTERKVMEGLKDFQRATVERIFSLYMSGQNRVLVADEVGLGKTLIAKGVIAKTAKHHKENLKDDLFKVIYICSNQNIANQNINKLKISSDITVDGVSDTRLSMQHLKIYEQNNDQSVKDKYIQLIPLTPSTSFSMTSGCGSVDERALMFMVLRRMPMWGAYIEELKVICIDTATSGWTYASPWFERRVEACDKISGGEYSRTITKAIDEYFVNNPIHMELITVCKRIRENGGKKSGSNNEIIYKLRMMFAQISVDLLKPDLVIMDEFQRFKFLISADITSEAGILADRFLKGNNIKILLLSATPYKLYSTLEEINETQSDDHYSEFLQVMNFLFTDQERQQEFKEIWNDFSVNLREVNFKDLSIISAKNNAENAMYQGVCRTERISAVQSGDFIDDKSVKIPLKVTEQDILSYIEVENLLKQTGQGYGVPVDYIKSAPYILSFMKKYQLKRHIEKYFQKNSDEIKLANKRHLWLDDRTIRNYGPLDPTNAKLERLKEAAFENNAEMLLWVPPARPYYEPQGVYKNVGNFSKILVFSAWEMVPRMIATLISYEAERKTIGKLAAQHTDKQNKGYFASSNNRFPVARLRFNVQKENPQAMSLFCLLYPSKALAELYNPIECLNAGNTLTDIENKLQMMIKELLVKFEKFQSETHREDERWYYIAPLLLDLAYPNFTNSWLAYDVDLISEKTLDEEELKEKGNKGFRLHLDKLKEYYQDISSIMLGRMPEDLVFVLANMAIASPAVCAYRANGENGMYASQLAKTMINQFNKPEATAVIEICYGIIQDEAHWRNVLSYCQDGNIQSMMDEFVHMLVESNGLNHADNKHELIHSLMLDSIKTHSASYTVDTFNTFRNSIVTKKEKGIALRSHYAVGFYKDEGDNSKVINRKESIRNSFNSPFQPFVLATTSIGQEGLDFHYYCRKIMHWNLPSNPIDLEQREGRINRFKCLAIRQNIALMYGNKVNFKTDIWNEMFECAKDDFKTGYSELVPFWCLPDNQEIKIERIIPIYPISKDIGTYERLIKILSLYRLTLGQARQEELLEYIFKNSDNSDDLKGLFINLSPYYKDKVVSTEYKAIINEY